MLISDREGKWEENVYKCRFHYFFKHGSMDILSSSLVLGRMAYGVGRPPGPWLLSSIFTGSLAPPFSGPWTQTFAQVLQLSYAQCF